MINQKTTAMGQKETMAGFLFLLPLLIGLSIFYFYAFFQNIFISFTDMSSFGKPAYIGLENYKRLLTDPKFWRSLKTTFKYVAVSVPAVMVLGTLVAFFLQKARKWSSFFRTAMFLPAVTMPAAIGLLWRWLYNYEFGLINIIFSQLDIARIAWLSEPALVVYSISIVLIWSMVSTQMIILLAGLQNIPTMYYEAAEIDGASPFQSFFKITLPLLSPTLFFVTIISVINIFQIFDFIFLMIQPTALAMRYAMSLVYYFYDRAFIVFDKGYAASLSMVLFVIILLITIIQFVFQKKWVHYN